MEQKLACNPEFHLVFEVSLRTLISLTSTSSIRTQRCLLPQPKYHLNYSEGTIVVRF